MKRLRSLSWPVAFFTVTLVAIGLGAKLHSISRTLDHTYRYDCTIKAVDGETFKALKIMGANGPGSNKEDLFSQSYATAFTPDGSLKISGIAYEPRKVGIAVDGYRAKAITITSETPALLEIPMTKVPADEVK
ncbi:MAG: hypothetical protein V4689_07310 [Verrucomicrobiota bacterium]